METDRPASTDLADATPAPTVGSPAAPGTHGSPGAPRGSAAGTAPASAVPGAARTPGASHGTADGALPGAVRAVRPVPTPPVGTAPVAVPALTSFVAVGDSFTEGMSDGLPDGSYRGWADLLAARLAVRSPGFRYANLAVRGKLIGQIVAEQAGTAAAMRADLVTVVGGLNDVLRPKCDVDEVCRRLEEAVRMLAPSCRQLVLMRSPVRRGPVATRMRPRMTRLFDVVEELGARYGAVVVDLFGAEVLGDGRLWADDRLHLNADGHRRVAEAVWQALGLPEESAWREPLEAYVPPPWATRRASDLRFAREHLLPWIGRRLTGRSSGDGLPPKRAELLPLAPERGDRAAGQG